MIINETSLRKIIREEIFSSTRKRLFEETEDMKLRDIKGSDKESGAFGKIQQQSKHNPDVDISKYKDDLETLVSNLWHSLNGYNKRESSGKKKELYKNYNALHKFLKKIIEENDLDVRPGNDDPEFKSFRERRNPYLEKVSKLIWQNKWPSKDSFISDDKTAEIGSSIDRIVNRIYKRINIWVVGEPNKAKLKKRLGTK